MRVLITGNMGYIGPVLSKYLAQKYPNISLIGYDSGFFGQCLTSAKAFPERLYQQQYFGDIRDISHKHLEGVDAIVHLAAISNDPMGSEFEEITEKINRESSVRLVQMAIKAGVKNFVFASSCSMYGATSSSAKKETDPTSPLTAYARSKVGAESDISGLNLNGMVVTSLRFATACGMSDRLRLDLVLNDFVACALTSKKITVLSDGSPWRPLIDVQDMSRAIDWAINRPQDLGGIFLAINAGRNENNYQVKDLAMAVAALIPDIEISINKNAALDLRSYKVDFSLFHELAPLYLPQVTLNESITQLREGLTSMEFLDPNFRGSQYIRLNTLRAHIQSKRLDNNFRWTF